MGVVPKYKLDNQIEVLFSIADEYQNKGYVTEAAAALINWVFEHEKTMYIVAIVKHDQVFRIENTTMLLARKEGLMWVL